MRSRLGVLAFAVSLMFASVSQAELFPGDDPNEVFIIVPADTAHAGEPVSLAPGNALQSESFPGDDQSETLAIMPAEASGAGDAASATPASIPQTEPAAGSEENEVSAVAPADPATTDDASSPSSAGASEAKLFLLPFRSDESETLAVTNARHSVDGEPSQSRGFPELDPYELNENPGDLPGIID